MRVLLVSHVPKDPFGGSSRVYNLLEDGLLERGHHVKALHYEDFGVPPRCKGVINRLLLPQAASRRAAQEHIKQFDVIMASSGMLYPLYKRLQSEQKRPLLIAHYPGSAFLDNQAEVGEMMRGHLPLSWVSRHITGPLRSSWDQRGSQFADLTFVHNGRDMDLALEKGAAEAELLPLPVHPEILAAAVNAVRPEEKNPHSLLWFGSWDRRKGTAYLPRAFKAVIDRYPETRLTIGGAGRSAETIRHEFGERLMRHITILPRVSVAEQIIQFNKHSIFMFPSLSEGFGFALLEAMSMGLASVTTSTGLGADWLNNRDNAMVVPPSSAHHIAQATVSLMEDQLLRCKISRRCRAFACEFTVKNYVDQCESRFERSLDHLRNGSR